MTNQPVAPPVAVAPRPTIRPARCEIEFMDEDGYVCRLVLEAESAGAVLQMQAQARAHLQKIGAKPTPRVPPVAQHAEAASAGDAPKCKYHGGQMKQGKGGKWFCPKRIAGGAYCDYTVEA